MTKSFRGSIISAISGNLMEFFNFILYVYFAPYISHHFFPQEDPFISTLITISVFSSGYLIRPFGALVMGHIGDRLGRKKALMLSIGLMTGSTLVIGLTPSFESIGLFATLTIIGCRLVQGFAVSGEESGAAVFLGECAPNKKGFMGSIIVGSAQLGVMFGALVCFVVTQLFTESQMMDWAWRIPFLISLPFGFLSYQLRKNDKNHGHDKNIISKMASTNPVKVLLKDYKQEVMIGTSMVGCGALIIYIHNVFLAIYFNSIGGAIGSYGHSLVNISIVSLCVTLPLMGWLSDKIGPESLFNKSVLLMALLAIPLFAGVAQGHTIVMGLCMLLFSFLTACICAPFFSLLLDLFPMKVRFTGVSLVFNLAMSVMGSTAPIIALYLTKSAWGLTMVGGYISLMLMVLLTLSIRLSGAVGNLKRMRAS